ncbi:RAQPRD family integrative conjugative element protein [Motilimonas cestriensis]|uniref:integrative conjugative element protein, RAQPRD family n=1 Tax=Motilimonas cestriensis TaxID=2742685 RepID=UPI003DA2071E
MKKLLSGLMITSAFLSSQVLANVWVEREKLEQIESNLAALHVLIEEAKAQSKQTNYKHRFDYKQLTKDVDNLREGINHYLTSPLEPAPIQDLSEDYGEYK